MPKSLISFNEPVCFTSAKRFAKSEFTVAEMSCQELRFDTLFRSFHFVCDLWSCEVINGTWRHKLVKFLGARRVPTWPLFCNASREALSSRSSRQRQKKPDRSPCAPHIEQLSIRLSFQLIFFASDAKYHQTWRRPTLPNSLSFQKFDYCQTYCRHSSWNMPKVQ